VKYGKQTCWDSVTKLELPIKKASSSLATGSMDREKLLFMIRGVHYYCDNNMLSPNKISITDMGGTTKTPRRLLDILCFKMDVLGNWLTVVIDDCRLSAADKVVIRKNMSDFATFERSIKEGPWQSLLHPSGRKFAELVEAAASFARCGVNGWLNNCSAQVQAASLPLNFACVAL